MALFLCLFFCCCYQVEKEEQAKREAEEAQAQAQQGDQWSSVAPPTDTIQEGQWDAGDVRAVLCSNVHELPCPSGERRFFLV